MAKCDVVNQSISNKVVIFYAESIKGVKKKKDFEENKNSIQKDNEKI